MQTAAANVTPETVLQFFDKYDAADNTVREAVGMRKSTRISAKGEGIELTPFDRMRKLSRQSGDERQRQDRALRYYMSCIGMPLDYEAPESRPATPSDSTLTEHQKRKVEADGYDAGRSGQDRHSNNKWSPGTLLYQLWDGAWVRGAEALAQTQVEEPPQPKKRGRPAGSKNKPKTNSHAGADTLV